MISMFITLQEKAIMQKKAQIQCRMARDREKYQNTYHKDIWIDSYDSSRIKK